MQIHKYICGMCPGYVQQSACEHLTHHVNRVEHTHKMLNNTTLCTQIEYTHSNISRVACFDSIQYTRCEWQMPLNNHDTSWLLTPVECVFICSVCWADACVCVRSKNNKPTDGWMKLPSHWKFSIVNESESTSKGKRSDTHRHAHAYHPVRFFL